MLVASEHHDGAIRSCRSGGAGKRTGEDGVVLVFSFMRYRGEVNMEYLAAYIRID